MLNIPTMLTISKCFCGFSVVPKVGVLLDCGFCGQHSLGLLLPTNILSQITCFCPEMCPICAPFKGSSVFHFTSLRFCEVLGTDQTFRSNIFWISGAPEFNIQMIKCTIWKKQEIG